VQCSGIAETSLAARERSARLATFQGVATEPLTITILEGDETGQELLDQALRVLDPEVVELPITLDRHDLSLEHRRATGNQVVEDAATAMRASGLGIKAATITPEGKDDVGSPNRIVREGVDGKVIIRTGRRIPGITPVAGVYLPISVVRMAVDDAYGAEQWREGTEGGTDEIAYRTEKISRSVCTAVAEYAFRTAKRLGGKVYGGPKWTVSPVYEGMLKEEMDFAAERHPDVWYQPVLIDATYAGLISGAADSPLVIPALNRDGDCLSDLVMPMFGSIAGAESVLLAFDEDFKTTVAMAEAPHGTAPALQGKDIANPMAMILACGAVLNYAAEKGHAGAERASRAIYEAVLESTARGVRTHDLGGSAGTTEFTDDVIGRVRTKLDVWSSLGTTG
jgi:isocitrate dehydrogenase (NAD+)